MVCPICHQETSEIRNNNFYCPNCKIFLGPATSQNKEVIPVSNWKMTTGVGVGLPPSQEKTTFSYKSVIDAPSSIKRYIIVCIIVMFLFSAYFLTSSIGSYIDVGRFCKIKVEGSSHGNTETVFKAIEQLKNSDDLGYASLCSYVNKIVEGQCNSADYLVDPQNFRKAFDAGGCYVKGTKIIYLTPDPSGSSDSISKRADVLKKDANYAMAYWTSN